MVASFAIALSLLLASWAWASPLPPPPPPLILPTINPNNWFCVIPFISEILCSTATTSGLTVYTSVGTAQGVVDTSGVNRFAVRYASAERWGASSAANTWELPNGSNNVSALPLMCPQPFVADNTFTEDCLSMLLYVPDTIKAGSNVPTLVWIHGGSFIIGSATDPGLDGSALAAATDSIVAVIQYRLGILGFNAPNGDTNMGVKDVVSALQFLDKVLPSFGGDSSKITLAGQSSGANMIRALLAAPSASSLFQYAILQSDPMDYGFLSVSDQQQLQAYLNPMLNCTSTDTSCLDSLTLDGIINAELNFYDNAVSIIPAATASEPIRVVNDGSFITSTLDSTSPFPHVSKPILLSNVLDEAGYSIYGSFDSPVPIGEYTLVVNGTFGTQRTETLMDNPAYLPTGAAQNVTEDYRPQLQLLGTDSVWRCATWTFARNWVQNGGTAYVGVYVVGATYPGNQDVSFCTESGVVCHQDDIEIVFGTVPSPTSAQSALVTEMQARYKSFINTGNPNPSGSTYANWQPSTSNITNAILLGGDGDADVGTCVTTFWGEAVQYDYQVYNI